jgi:hypothetical protein
LAGYKQNNTAEIGSILRRYSHLCFGKTNGMLNLLKRREDKMDILKVHFRYMES